MAPTTVEDDLKLLYAYSKLSGGKARTGEIAKFMGLKTGATAWRFSALMKRLEKQFGPVDGGAATETQSSPPKVTKRKKGKDGAEDEADDAGKASKKAKLTAEKPKGEEA
ncbi:hypothetical protein DV735_g5941, partial [Chaetothyriales sp. CBS 134920]